MPDDEFYIGYQNEAPPHISKKSRTVVIMLCACGALICTLLVFSQNTFYPSRFEYLQHRSFEGVINVDPYPMLVMSHPKSPADGSAFTRFLLVNEGKWSASSLVSDFDGQSVSLNGTLIYRDDQSMIEVVPGTVAEIEPSNDPRLPFSEKQSLGHFTLQGEIVDSKCFLGVMNPGSGKPHRACATRCISGGIPPVFVVRLPDGASKYFLLTAEDGTAVNHQVLEMIAEPLEITGTVFRQDNVLYLRADPTSYRRLK